VGRHTNPVSSLVKCVLCAQDSLSEGIVFCRNSEEEEEEDDHPSSPLRPPKSSSSPSKGVDESDATTGKTEQRRIIQINTLYIQMEFCEKKTLRDSIDGGLYKETSKVWRMFR
jgi:translation initiation factor 2-alpha kinase 4